MATPQTLTIAQGQVWKMTPDFTVGGTSPGSPPAPSSYALLDDFGVNPQDKGVITTTPDADTLSLDFTGAAIGTQRVRMTSGPLTADTIVTVTAAPPPVADTVTMAFTQIS